MSGIRNAFFLLYSERMHQGAIQQIKPVENMNIPAGLFPVGHYHRLAVIPLLMKRMCAYDTRIHQIFISKAEKYRGASFRISYRMVNKITYVVKT